jgi:hypothetical protein
MPIVDSWLGVVIVSLVAFVASTSALKPDWSRVPALVAEHKAAILSHLFFVLTISCPPVIRHLGGDSLTIKATGVLLLSLAHHLRLAVHPLLPPPSSSLRTHLSSFVPLSLTALATSYFLQGAGFAPGYPALPHASLTNAFLVVFSIFLVYLLLFADLIRKGYSRHWANLALLIVLHSIDVQPFHPNPVVTLVSAFANGAHAVYAVHVAAVAAAVIAARAIERVKVRAAASKQN